MSKYVQQISTGIIFVSTPYLEKMAGMRPLQDSESEALLRPVAQPETPPEPVTEPDPELSEPVTQPELTDEPPTDPGTNPVDGQTYRELIEAATTKEQIESLVLQHTGKDVDRRKSLDTLKAEALA